MYSFALVFLLFIIFSFVGWLMEVIAFLIFDKKLVNRGFLLGPYCPVYGISAILMTYFLASFKDNYILLFVLSSAICLITEYLVSYICEKMFNARWWDYSGRKFNLNGRVYLPYTILFGILGLTTVSFAEPVLINTLKQIPANILYVYFFILLIIFTIDLITSIIVMYKIKNTTKGIKQDNTEEIKAKIKRIIEKQSWRIKQMFKANIPINFFKIRKP